MSMLPSAIPQTAPKPGRLVALLRRYPLFCYFFIAYLLSWSGWLPLVLSQSGLGFLPFRLPLAAIVGGALGPIGSGFLLTAITSGKAGLCQLLRRFILWRVGVQWYGFAILGFPALLLLGIVVAIPGALAAFRLSMLSLTLLLYTGFLIVGMFISPLAEEPGWRGFALPRLQERSGPLMGSIILGLFWGCWHFPLFLLPGYYVAGTGFLGVGIPFGEFLVGIIAGTIIITWVFNHTRGSLLIALLIHSAIDDFPMPLLFPHKNISGSDSLVYLISFGALALVILVVTRGKLGYRGMVSAPKVSIYPAKAVPGAVFDRARSHDQDGLEH